MTQIYVLILNEEIDVWRPVEAINLGNNKYKISENNEYNEAIEKWEFVPGDVVECMEKKFEYNLVPVASKKVSNNQ